MAKKRNGWDLAGLILLIIGGINWLLVGIFNWNLVGAIFNGWAPVITTIIYIVVGVAALYTIFWYLPKK